jgi:hypothetical protein
MVVITVSKKKGRPGIFIDVSSQQFDGRRKGGSDTVLENAEK